MRSLTILLITSLSLLPLAGQQSVSVLMAEGKPVRARARASTAGQPFDFDRNLIFFRADIEGEAGQFILDTGAPTLLLNHRGTPGERRAAGRGVGGDVALTNVRVSSFTMAGRQHGSRWALGLDLRPMETRTGRRIDGFVGYEMLRNGELRIDYAARRFSLLRSLRKPRHAGLPPTHVLSFRYVDHLPVVTLRVNGRRLRFIIDTAAGVNLLDPAYAELATRSDRRMNIQGLSGEQHDYEMATVEGLLGGTPAAFALVDLHRLQRPGQPPVAGVLGSSFLSQYCLGVDYRRRRLNLW